MAVPPMGTTCDTMARIIGARLPADLWVTLVSANSSPSASSLRVVAMKSGSDSTTASNQKADFTQESGMPITGPAGERVARYETPTKIAAINAALRSICSNHFRMRRVTMSGLRRSRRPTQSV